MEAESAVRGSESSTPGGAAGGRRAPAIGDLGADLARLRADESERAEPRRRRGLRWVVLIGLALGGAAAAYSPAVRESDALAGLVARVAALVGEEAPEVRVVPVTRREIGLPPVVLSAVGYLVPEREITIEAAAPGRVVEMPVSENQRVQAGDLLARLESRDARAQLQLAQVDRDEAQRQLQLTRELFDVGSRTRTQLQLAQAAFERAEAGVRLARGALAKTVLRAPWEGTVVRKLRDVGELLTIGVTARGDPGTAVVTLADLDPLHVALEINETEIGKLSVGMTTLITPEASPDRSYLGELVEIGSRADRSKGVVPARARVRDADEGLLPNMTVSVRVLSAPPAAEVRALPSVPRSARVRRAGRDVVFTVEEGVARAVPVVLAQGPATPAASGPRFTAEARDPSQPPEFVALLEGPEEGRYVIESPPATLSAGDPVRTAP